MFYCMGKLRGCKRADTGDITVGIVIDNLPVWIFNGSDLEGSISKLEDT